MVDRFMYQHEKERQRLTNCIRRMPPTAGGVVPDPSFPQDNTKVKLQLAALSDKLDEDIQQAAAALSNAYIRVLEELVEEENELGDGDQPTHLLDKCTEKGNEAIKALLTRFTSACSLMVHNGLLHLEQSQEGTECFELANDDESAPEEEDNTKVLKEKQENF